MLKIAYNLLFHPHLFRPTAMIDHVSQLSQIVPKQGINYLVLDKDDTIVPVYEFTINDKKIHDTLNNLRNFGKFIIVVSNSVVVDEKNQPPEIRVNNHDVFYGIMLTKYPKPFNGQQIEDFLKIQHQLNPAKLQFEKDKVAIVGDRLLTDIHLGNLMGWKSYLVKPLEQTTIAKHGIGVYLMRHFENFIIKRANYPRYQPTKETASQKKP